MSFHLTTLIAKGESSTLELKRSTGELRETMQTLCSFANGKGGRVVVGVNASGEVVGQQVSEQTLLEIAAIRERFEPPLDFAVDVQELGANRSVIVFSVLGLGDSVPFTFDGRAFERVGNTTRKMAQDRYERLLLERAHSRRRWENQEADEIALQDLDLAEAFRIVEAARSVGRLVGPVGRNPTELLERLGVRHKGRILRAAVVLFGKTFLPDYPQCELRMARFRGGDKTEFLDQRNVRGPAFRLLEEAELFCQRHFPLPGHIEPRRLQRVDRPVLPPEAMREILVNALIHRDYSIAGGAISLAIFDDRVELWSAGKFPTGITPESLLSSHNSVQRNPLIAEVFHRAGLIEKWGRGTNRVAEMCRSAGVAPPEFAEVTGAALVTFRISIAPPAPGQAGTQPGHPHPQFESPAPQPESPIGQLVSQFESPAPQLESPIGQLESQLESPAPQLESSSDTAASNAQDPLEGRVLALLAAGPLSRSRISQAVGQKRASGQLHAVLKRLLERRAVEYTIPDKPGSRLQKYQVSGQPRAE